MPATPHHRSEKGGRAGANTQKGEEVRVEPWGGKEGMHRGEVAEHAISGEGRRCGPMLMHEESWSGCAARRGGAAVALPCGQGLR